MIRNIIFIISWPLHFIGDCLHRVVVFLTRGCMAKWPRLCRVARSRKLYSVAVAIVVTAVGEHLIEHHIGHPLLGDGVTAFGLSPLIRIIADAIRVEV